MSESLRDQLSQAFDTHTEAPAETPAPEVVQETPKETPEPSARSQAAISRTREEDGKFAKEQREKAEKPPVVTKPRPTSWKKDYEEHWGKLDPTLQDYIHQREGEYAKGVSTYKQEWDRAKPILDAFAPYGEMLQRYNVRPEQIIQNMMMRHQVLTQGSPQEKLQAFAQFARDYGVPLQALLPQTGPNGQPVPQPPMDPRLGMFAQQMSQMQKQFDTWRTEQERATQHGIGREIDTFSKDGKHPHFEVVKETMANLLERGLAETLEQAYSLALRMPQHDDIRTAMEEEARKAAQAANVREAAERAASARRRNVIPRSSGPSGTSEVPERKGLRDTIAEAVDSHAGRV